MKSNWEPGHSGVFAKNFDRTLQYYKALGLAPDLGPPPAPSPSADRGVNIEFGKIENHTDPTKPFRLGLLYIGDLELEVLNAPAERPEGEALAYGEGINHICYTVPDIDAETDELVKKGLRIVQDFRRNGVRLEDYLDTRQYGNIFLSMRPLQSAEVKARKASYGIVNWKFHGHDAVVRDLEKTTSYYQSLDIAAISPQTVFDSSSMAEVKVYAKNPKTKIVALTRMARIGTVTFEFFQPLEGDSIYQEYLDRKGEGIIDIIFTVDDLESETAKLVGKGVPVIFSVKPAKGKAFACFDTRADGGDIMIKLVQR
jgi:catechol 2,3-dioxygenase-like lactoylglutathione lyase family enzyme